MHLNVQNSILTLPAELFSFPTVGQIRQENINTRQRDSLFVPRFCTDTGARSLHVIGPKFWNRLPAKIRSCHTLNTFKSQLYIHLLNQDSVHII